MQRVINPKNEKKKPASKSSSSTSAPAPLLELQNLDHNEQKKTYVQSTEKKRVKEEEPPLTEERFLLSTLRDWVKTDGGGIPVKDYELPQEFFEDKVMLIQTEKAMTPKNRSAAVANRKEDKKERFLLSSLMDSFKRDGELPVKDFELPKEFLRLNLERKKTKKTGAESGQQIDLCLE